MALGVDKIAGGAASVLWVGTAIYFAATILGLRLPERVDAAEADDLAHSDVPAGHTPGRGREPRGAGTAGNGAGPGGTRIFGPPAGPAAARPGSALPGATPLGSAPGSRRPDSTPAGSTPAGSTVAGRRRRIFALPKVGPAVGEAWRADVAIRIFYGFILFFLAFILRSEPFGHTSNAVKLGGLAAAVAAGGIIGTVIGSALKSRAPQVMVFTVLGLATVVSIACAVFFALWSVLVVALVAAISQTLVKVALDSILQREIPAEKRSSTFAFSETLHQLALVAGGLIGLLLSLTGSGFAGLTWLPSRWRSPCAGSS